MDEMYYTASADIACKDRSKSFSRDRLNDGFCDCVDGTDEPAMNKRCLPGCQLMHQLMSVVDGTAKD
ncbi:hypothetical protein ACLOJK_010415 [Asimina triloba]